MMEFGHSGVESWGLKVFVISAFSTAIKLMKFYLECTYEALKGVQEGC